MAKLKLTWVKSSIGYSKNQKQTLKALGFRRLNQSVEQEDSDSIKGMINKVNHLIECEVIDNATT